MAALIHAAQKTADRFDDIPSAALSVDPSAALSAMVSFVPANAQKDDSEFHEPIKMIGGRLNVYKLYGEGTVSFRNLNYFFFIMIFYSYLILFISVRGSHEGG